MNIKFSSNVCLNPSENERYQLVYDTQLYHSFFGVYAQFKTAQTQENEIKIERINFVGITYKGLINFDFVRATINASSSSDHLMIDIEIKISKSLQPKSDKYMLDLTRKDIRVESNSYLEVNRKLLPIFDPNRGSRNDIEDAFVNGVFDEEFYDRDGLFIRKKDPVFFEREHYIGDRIPGDPDPIELEESIKNTESLASPGIRCIPGISKIWI